MATAVATRIIQQHSTQRLLRSFQRKTGCRFFGNSMMPFVPTCDVYDRFLEACRVPLVSWQSYGGRSTFSGPIVTTIRCFDDNSRLKDLMSDNDGSNSVAQGGIMVIDAGGPAARCAVLGDNMAAAAAKQGYSGIVVYGRVRDVSILSTLDIGIVATGCLPRKSVRRGEGQVNEQVNVGDITCQPGDYLLADADGVVILTTLQAEALRNDQK